MVPIWKSIPGHPGYEASNFGRIRSVDRLLTYRNGTKRIQPGKILALFNGPNGYLITHLGRSDISKYVHQLVASAFLGPCPKGMEVCHNNNNKTYNWAFNLRYDTRKGNLSDRPIKWVRTVNGVPNVA